MARWGGLLLLLLGLSLANSFGDGAPRSGGYTDQQEHAINRLNLDAAPVARHKVFAHPPTCPPVPLVRRARAVPEFSVRVS